MAGGEGVFSWMIKYSALSILLLLGLSIGGTALSMQPPERFIVFLIGISIAFSVSIFILYRLLEWLQKPIIDPELARRLMTQDPEGLRQLMIEEHERQRRKMKGAAAGAALYAAGC